MALRFGNTLRSIRGGLVATGVMGVLAGLVGLGATVELDTSAGRWPWLVFVVFVPPLGFLFACLPTLAVGIRINGGRVQHLLFGWLVLSDYPVAEFQGMKILQRPWGAVLHFGEGRRVRFVGAHVGELVRLEHELARQRGLSAGVAVRLPDFSAARESL